MSPDDLNAPRVEGTTPLDPDEAEGLIPAHIVTRGQLNEWEQRNILRAEAWLFARRRGNLLALAFVLELHRRMFDETWTWAGSFRRSDKNIGVSWPTIPERLRNLLDDTGYWLEHGTFELDEAAVRFHHRIVQIHPFPNGNGRHGRLITDALLRSRGRPSFTWGAGADLLPAGETRAAYIGALKAADGDDIAPLLAFCRS